MEPGSGSHLPPIPGAPLLRKAAEKGKRRQTPIGVSLHLPISNSNCGLAEGFVDSGAQASNPARSAPHLDQVLIGGFHQDALNFIESAHQALFVSFTTRRSGNFRAEFFHYRFVPGAKSYVVDPTFFRLPGRFYCRFVSRHALFPILKKLRILGKSSKKSKG